MKRISLQKFRTYLSTTLVALALLSAGAFAQVPMDVHIQIFKAEDSRRYDKILEDLMKSPNADVRRRAALAAGRIGNDEALPRLSDLLEDDPSVGVRTMAAFAIGEVESMKSADVLIRSLASMKNSPATAGNTELRARLVEAAGKIAAANSKDEKAKSLGTAMVDILDFELIKKSDPSVNLIRLGLTAVLRAKPAGAEEMVRKFLAYTDPNIVADALNTLTRLRAKNANRDARDLLQTHLHAMVRANAARVLGGAEDKEAVDILIKAATSDPDLRVRVSAIRSLAALKDVKAVDPLGERVYKLIADYNRSRFGKPTEKNELLELFTTLGRLKQGSKDEKVFSLISIFGRVDKYTSPEYEIALARIDPERYIDYGKNKQLELKRTWRALSSSSQAAAVFAELPDTPENNKLKKQMISYFREAIDKIAALPVKERPLKAMPDVIRAYAAFKPDDLDATLSEFLTSDDVFIRATAAELIAERPLTSATLVKLQNAFKESLTTDLHDNDAQLALLEAVNKLDKKGSIDTLVSAFGSPDYLVRKKAFELLADNDLQTHEAKVADKNLVLPYAPESATKLGQVLNSDADYRSALSRKNGAVKALVTTEKGAFTIDLLPEDAPLTVDNFVKLARANYFNGLEVHRVVPNFVMQDGDPRGDGNGGPGWSIRCEINMVPFERGAVGMALSGKDTGGSQWFVTHSAQPHLDGGYTVFGKVNETGMKVVDNIVRGDKIISIKIVETVNRARRK